MSPLDFHVEPLTRDLIDEMLPMQQQYWNEVASPFHQFPPDVDWNTYLALEQAGRLRLIVGRDRAGVRAVVFVIIAPHPHYACMSASIPLLFVHPDHRRGYAGIRLMRMAEQEAEKAGAQLMMAHGGMHNNVYRLFEGLKYDNFGTYYVKVLAGGPNGLTPVFKEK